MNGGWGSQLGAMPGWPTAPGHEARLLQQGRCSIDEGRQRGGERARGNERCGSAERRRHRTDLARERITWRPPRSETVHAPARAHRRRRIDSSHHRLIASSRRRHATSRDSCRPTAAPGRRRESRPRLVRPVDAVDTTQRTWRWPLLDASPNRADKIHYVNQWGLEALDVGRSRPPPLPAPSPRSCHSPPGHGEPSPDLVAEPNHCWSRRRRCVHRCCATVVVPDSLRNGPPDPQQGRGATGPAPLVRFRRRGPATPEGAARKG